MVKITVFILICGIIIVYLKSINSELTLLMYIITGLMIVSFSLSYISETVTFFNGIISDSGINKQFFSIIFKITAIGYIVEFGAGVLDDFGLNSLSHKLIFIGKLIILSVSLPVFYAFINLIKNF